MADADVQKREPEQIAAGDSLAFERYFPKYLPADGWAIEYVVTDLQSNQILSLNSIADGKNHLVALDGFMAGKAACDYILAGFAINGAERHEIYRGVLTVGPDFANNAAQGSLKTEAQEMIEILRASLKQLYQQQFQSTDVQRNRFIMQKQSEVRQELAYWTDRRVNEIQLERARNGKPSGAMSVPRFCIG